MTRLTCSVDKALLAQFPGYMRGVIWADSVSNDESPYALTALLEDETFYQPLSATRLIEHPRVTCWQKVYATLGGDERVDMPPFARLAERVLQRRHLPLSTIVQDIAVILSLWHLAPVAACALDELHKELTLRLASGDETPTPLDTVQEAAQHASESEYPRPGEPITADGMRVVMRGWNRSQTSGTHVRCGTRAVALLVDALPVIQLAELQGICEEGVSLLETFCGATAQYAILRSCAPAVILD